LTYRSRLNRAARPANGAEGLPTPDLVLKAVKTVALRRRGRSARHYATHKRARNGLGKSDDLHAGKMLIRKLIKAFTDGTEQPGSEPSSTRLENFR